MEQRTAPNTNVFTKHQNVFTCIQPRTGLGQAPKKKITNVKLLLTAAGLIAGNVHHLRIVIHLSNPPVETNL